MFPGQPGAGQPDVRKLLQQAQQMQRELAAAQQRLAEARITGSAGGDLVTAVMDGTGELVGLEIDPRAVDPSDVETLADLVMAAVRDAAGNARREQERVMGPFTQGIGDLTGGFGLPGVGR